MDDLEISDSFNGFYQFNNSEIYSSGSWSNQLLDPTRLCNWFMVEPGSTTESVRF